MSVPIKAYADGSPIWLLLPYTLETFTSSSIHVEMYSAGFGLYHFTGKCCSTYVCAMCLYVLFHIDFIRRQGWGRYLVGIERGSIF